MAGKYDLQIDQGSHFSITFIHKDSNNDPYDLTNWSAKMQIRLSRWDDTEDALVTVEDGDGIVLGGLDGTVTVDITATQTGSLPTGDLVYDVLLTDPDGKRYRLIQGKADVNPRVTI